MDSGLRCLQVPTTPGEGPSLRELQLNRIIRSTLIGEVDETVPTDNSTMQLNAARKETVETWVFLLAHAETSH